MISQTAKVKSQSDSSKVKTELKQRVYAFCVNIVKFTSEIETTTVSRCLVDQLVRSGTSVGANIIEAKSASSRRDFIRFYEIALKSANETKFWLCLMRDGLNIKRTQIEPLLNETTELSNILAASVITLKDRR